METLLTACDKSVAGHLNLLPPPLLDIRIILNNSKALNRSEVKHVELGTEVNNGLVLAGTKGELVEPQAFSSGVPAQVKDYRYWSRGLQEAFVVLSKCKVDFPLFQRVEVDLVLKFGWEGGEGRRLSGFSGNRSRLSGDRSS